MTLRSFTLAALAITVGCAGSQAPPAAAPPTRAPAPAGASIAAAPTADAPAGRTLAADEVIRMASGASFTASTGWWIAAGRETALLRTPEADLRWYHVELDAADRDAAIAAAWQRVAPGFALAVEHTEDAPPRDGWDAMAQVAYKVPPEAQRVVFALARRYAGRWYIELVDGSPTALDRRRAQLSNGLQSLNVPGKADESFAGKPARLDADFAPKLDAFVRETMEQARIPGLAIAVVHGDKVEFARGWGVRRLGDAAKVTPATRFMIGSVGKSLTSLLMARMVDRGALRWDSPVTELLPDFALADPEITRALTVRHTVCACTGMPRRDAELLFDGEATPEQRIAALRGERPTTAFGETFQYSNLMVALGGYAAAHVFDRGAKLAPAYEHAMRDLVFRPLGMAATTLDLAAAARGNFAVPHPRDLSGAPIAQAAQVERWAGTCAPAGSTWSTVEDMARVLRLELGDGRLDGVQLVSHDALAARRKPQVKITDHMAYGLGLVLEADHSVDVVWHNGGTAGFTSLFWFLPEHQLGAVILTNAGDALAAVGAIRRRMFELWFGARERAASDLSTALDAERRERAEVAARLTGADPAWARAFLGAWRAPGLGQIELRRAGGHLVLDSGQWQVELVGATTHDGKPQLVSASAPFAGIELVPDGDGPAAKLTGMMSGQDRFVFERVAR